MSYQSDYDDDREDWAKMHDWSNFETPSSGSQDMLIKDLEEQKCILESDYKKSERGERRHLTAKRASRLIKRGLKRQKEIKLQKAKLDSCY